MDKNERLKKVRQYFGLTLAEFGKRIHLSAGALSDIERGRRNLTDRTADDICRVFSVSKIWLLEGRGEMLSVNSSDELEALARKYNLSLGMQVFIEKLVSQPENVQDAVIDLIVETAAAISDTDSRIRPSDYNVNDLKDTAASEAAYRKAFGIASEPESPASNITDGIA